MTTFIALLRGINVGGNNLLPMQQLKQLLVDLGAAKVRTYIQSGNAVFEHPSTDAAGLGARITAAIEAACGFPPATRILTAEQFRALAEANPFPEGVAEPKTLHLYFLEREPSSPDLDALAAVAKENERFELLGRCFYLHAPDGIGRSKLAAKVERAIGVPATARNWRTVQKILGLC